MFERPANRIYRNSELGLWLRRVACDWENFFRQEELLYGRKLYKTGAVRTLELNSSEAIICAKLPDSSEPYCILDFEGDEYVRRSNSSDHLLNAALSVAGFYEIEELVADTLGSDEFIDYDEQALLAKAKEENEKAAADGECAQNEETSEAASAPAAENAESGYPKLALSFSSRKKGLVFSASWEFKDGKTRRAFGEKCLPIAELTDTQRENLVRLATMSRKHGFKYDSEIYLLSEISKIPSFLQAALPVWEKYFIIRKDKHVDLLALGERSVELKPIAKNLASNDTDFDIEWVSSVGGQIIDSADLPKLMGGISTLRIVPEYGILRVSSDATTFVRNVERAREFGFEEGKIPRYMLLSISEFSGGMVMSDDLRLWMNSLTSRIETDELRLPAFLRNYQRRGVVWAKRLFDHDCNALIADEMGLGKTLQTLTLINLAANEDAGRKFFVACPASVIPVWLSEADKFFPQIKCGVLSSNSDFDTAQLWIASYTQLRRNRAQVEKISFHTAILDEAQFIKNPDAKTTSACMSIKAKRKIALTGTPVENRLLDMWTTFRWLMPGLMGQRTVFENAMQTDESFVKNMRRQIAPFVLRRLKSEVATELPEKIYVDLVCPMSEQQKSEYQKLLNEARQTLGGAVAEDAKARFTVLSLLTRLRQAACSSALLPWIGKEGVSDTGGKISVLSDKVEELYQSGKKILVFSQFTRFLDLIRENISARIPDAPIYELTGATRDRAKPVDAFQNGHGGAVMLISLRAGGTGITLTSADYVFLADPWWNPAVEEQAVDRVHRIGRRGDVFIYRMIAQDTVEDRVRNLQAQKKKLFNDLLGGLKDVSNHVKFIETVSDILS